jgi:DNA topoisomerase-6 subunit B
MAKKSAGNRGKKANAESMAAKQREISVSEFFAKNRHLLGFDNPRKALLTTIKEAVDNALDACEEAGILPDIEVKIEELSPDRGGEVRRSTASRFWTTGPASSASRSRTSSGGCSTARSSTA